MVLYSLSRLDIDGLRRSLNFFNSLHVRRPECHVTVPTTRSVFDSQIFVTNGDFAHLCSHLDLLVLERFSCGNWVLQVVYLRDCLPTYRTAFENIVGTYVTDLIDSLLID